jgi:hypothetical protein
MDGQPTVTADLEYFVGRHREHGRPFPTLGLPTPNGYRLEVACSCGMMFERWVFPDEADVQRMLELLRSGDRSG